MNRTIGASLVAGCIGATAMLATSAAAQDDPATTTTEAPFSASGTVEIELLDQSFDLAPNGSIDLTYRLTGDLATVAELVPPTTTTTTSTTTTTTTSTTEPAATIPDLEPTTPGSAEPDPPPTDAPTTTLPPPPQLTVRILNYEPIDDATDLAGVLGPDPRASRFPAVIDGVDFVEARAMIDVERDGLATLQLSVPTDVAPSVAASLEFAEDGIHPILMQLRVDDQVVARHGTVVERRSSGTSAPPTIDLAVMAAIADPGPTARDDEIGDAVDELNTLLDLAAHVDAPLSLDIPPSVAAAAVDAGALRDDATEVLAGDEVLAAPATPFDVSSATAVDRVDAFVRQFSAGESDMRDLLDIVVVRDVWLASEPLSGQGAQVLQDLLGVRYLAMPPAIYAETVSASSDDDETSSDDVEMPTRDHFVELATADGSTIPILVIDDETGNDFTAGRTEEILAEQTPMEWALQTVAAWRVAQYSAPSNERRDRLSRLLATPDLGAFDPALLVALETFADGTDAIRFTQASGLTSVTDTASDGLGAALPETAGPSLEARLDRIAIVQVDLDDTATMLPDDDPRPARWTRQLDSFVSTAFSDDTVDAQLDQLVDEAAAIRGGVVPPEPFTFTLTGREEQQIDIRVENTLDEPLRVILRLSSPRLTFPAGDMLVTLDPATTTKIDVPVKARSNGTSAVTVEILTPSPLERPLIEPVRLTSRVNAFTGLGQVLTGGFVLVLASWWISNWRSRRREREVREAREPTAVSEASAAD